MVRKRIGRYDLMTHKVGVLLRIHLPIHLTMPILYFFLRFFLNMTVKATNCFQMHGGSLVIFVKFKYIVISSIRQERMSQIFKVRFTRICFYKKGYLLLNFVHMISQTASFHVPKRLKGWDPRSQISNLFCTKHPLDASEGDVHKLS